MSSLFNQASLVVEPAVYENGKVYATKPFDGAGDLTFSRASNATRVASNGLIEKVRENQYYKSTAFATSSLFVVYGSTPTSTGTYPVDSSSLAYSFAITAPNQGFRISLPSSSSPRCFSIYLKDFNTVSLFTTGTASVLGTTADAGTINGYVRYVVQIGAGDIVMSIRPNNNSGTATTVYATAAQLEGGDIPTEYIVNDTTASVVSVGPVSGLPRLDYLNSSCPRLLLEPQRTNLALYSEQFDNAYWTKNRATITANTSATLDPSGLNGSDKVIETATTGFHGIERAFGTLSGDHSLSVFAKAAERNWVYLEFFTGAISYTTFFNLSTGAIGTTAAGNNAKIEAYGNGWYRLSISRAAGSGTSFFVAGTASADNTASYAGNGTSGAYFWGAQLEAGAYATSYIPTLGTSVTRVADAASKTGISSLIGQTEGTLFIETTYNGAANTGLFNRLMTISSGVDNNFIGLSKNSSTAELYVYAQTAAGVQVNSNPIANTNLVGTHKIALAYKANDYVLYVDGVQRFTDTSAAVPACSQLNIGNIPFFSGGDELGGGVNQALLFKTRLTNAQCQELTSL